MSCLTIRGAALVASAPAVIAEVERIEKAIAQLVGLIAELASEVESQAHRSLSDSSAGSKKVYPLFKGSRMMR
ncbi:MAG: hypothetical protein ACM3SP_11190 [Chloroflexota bacterium]